jgi:putative flavoprotein involved in K+ transport
MDWFEALGVLTESIDDVWDVAASRSQPSLQLVGSDDRRSIDLDVVQHEGVRVVGRMLGAYGRRIYLARDLDDSLGRADRKMHEQLDRIDEYIGDHDGDLPDADRPAPIRVPESPAQLDLHAEGIRTVLWATGYRRGYPWLQVPVLDARGEIKHDGGVTPEPGLYALGLHFMRRRNSAFLDGVGRDAAELADHIEQRMARRSSAA